jgi:hypothetical protein
VIRRAEQLLATVQETSDYGRKSRRVGKADGEMVQAGAAQRRRSGIGIPAVQRDVVVVRTAGKESRFLVALRHVEPEQVAVEPQRALEIAHRQVYMADIAARVDVCGRATERSHVSLRGQAATGVTPERVIGACTRIRRGHRHVHTITTHDAAVSSHPSLGRSVAVGARPLSSSCVKRLTAVALLLAAIAGMAVGGAQASVQPRDFALIARIAHDLAVRIRHESRSHSRSETRVLVRHGCCGRTTLASYFAAAPGQYSRFGGYKLLVVTRGSALLRVVVSQFATKVPYHLGTTPRDAPLFELKLEHRVGASEPWTGSLSTHVDPCLYKEPTPVPGQPTYCTGFGREIPLGSFTPAKRLELARAEAFAVIQRAVAHRPI